MQYKLWLDNGEPEMGLHYTGPGRSFLAQEAVVLERVLSEGETVTLIAPHGVRNCYTLLYGKLVRTS